MALVTFSFRALVKHIYEILITIDYSIMIKTAELLVLAHFYQLRLLAMCKN